MNECNQLWMWNCAAQLFHLAQSLRASLRDEERVSHCTCIHTLVYYNAQSIYIHRGRSGLGFKFESAAPAMEARNQAFVEKFCSDVLSDQHQTQLSLDPAERREVQQRVAEQAEASAQASVLALESVRQAQQYDAEGAATRSARLRNRPRAASCRVTHPRPQATFAHTRATRGRARAHAAMRAPPSTARLVQEVLEVAGVPLDGLSSKAQLSASLIAGLCSALGLARPSLQEMLAAWAQLKLRESRAAVLRVRTVLPRRVAARWRRRVLLMHRCGIITCTVAAYSFGRAAAGRVRKHWNADALCPAAHSPLCQAKLQQHSKEVERDATEAAARLEQLRAALAKVQQQQHSAERRARAEGQQVAELEAKQQEYARSLEKCARKLAANGATQEVRGRTDGQAALLRCCLGRADV